MADSIPAMLTPQVNTLKGDVPVTRFAPAGKVETGIVTVESIGERNAVILRQHGVMAAGKDLKEALYAVVYLEEAAQAYLAGQEHRGAGHAQRRADPRGDRHFRGVHQMNRR